MTDNAANSVLERKAQAQRKAFGGNAISMPRALGRSLSIAADALWGLGLACSPSTDDMQDIERALNAVSEDQLLLVLESETGSPAIAALDRDLVTGLVEVQTLGKVTRFPLETRSFTPTDASMMAPLIDAALPRFASMLTGQPEMEHLQGYSFGAFVEDKQTASLALQPGNYQVTSFDVSLANETRTGTVAFLFPEADKTAVVEDGVGGGKHEDVLKLVPTQMQAILTRIHIPLSKAQKLRPGDTLEISLNAVTSASLVADGGYFVTRGKLGQINGFRAIRIGEGDAWHQPEAVAEQLAEQASEARVAPSNAVATTPAHPPATLDIDVDGSIDRELEELAMGLPDPLNLADV